MRLLKLAFEDCSRVVVTKLHGGFSGSLVLKTDSYGLDGTRDEPTVTKLDDAVSMLEEVSKTAEFTKRVGASAAKVQRGPFLVDASGERIEAGASTDKHFGCVVLDVIELHGGLTLKQPQASIAYPPYTPCPQKLL